MKSEIRVLSSKEIYEVMQRHAQHMEKFAAAFLTEVGATDASNFQLIHEQRVEKDAIISTWRFERIK